MRPVRTVDNQRSRPLPLRPQHRAHLQGKLTKAAGKETGSTNKEFSEVTQVKEQEPVAPAEQEAKGHQGHREHLHQVHLQEVLQQVSQRHHHLVEVFGQVTLTSVTGTKQIGLLTEKSQPSWPRTPSMGTSHRGPIGKR